MTGQALALQFVQKFIGEGNTRPVYSMKEAISMIGSRNKAYRHLEVLRSLRIAEYYTNKNHGYFTVNTILASQPANIIEKILPSIEALKSARRFGRHYNNSDINFAMKNVNHKLVTLDYAVWELTKYQSPSDLYLYVSSFQETVDYLKDNKFSEGRRGHVVILPMIFPIDNEVQRIYFDCIANGGRSIQDAVAIELLFRDRLSYKANFPIELIQKVEEDLPTQQK